MPNHTAPLTIAERTAYERTSTHAEVMAFIEALREQRHRSLLVSDFGHTPEGRVLPLLVLSGAGHFTPEDARASGLPVVLVQCGIHAGEVEGKEAVLMLVRDLLSGRHGNILDRMVLLVVPLFNPDGNDRIDPANRRLDVEHFQGQMGPQSGVGTRENAAGINLNRDYMRQQGPEMRLMQTRICHPWNPHWVIDCHTTNGSVHRFAMTYDIPHVVDSGRAEPIEYMRAKVMPEVQAAVKAVDGLDSFWYGNFLRDEGGEGLGWITYPHHPRFGGNYRGLTNRLDLLLETYSYISFAERVRTTYAFLRESLKYAAKQGDEILTLLEAAILPPKAVAVRYRLEAFADRQARILTREPYRLDGSPIEVSVPHLACFVGEEYVERPLAYAVPAHIAEHLQRHGLTIEEPAGGEVRASIATIDESVVEVGRGILETGTSAHLGVTWREAPSRLPPGWRLVKTAQPRGAIAVYLCEPGSDDGLIACGSRRCPRPAKNFQRGAYSGFSIRL